MNYRKASKYPDLRIIYSQCSGPGGLQLTEYLANRMGLQEGRKLLDIGCNRGYQTCFLAKEYGLIAVGIDPWDDRDDHRPHIDHLIDNAREFGIESKVIGIKTGVPQSLLPSDSFDYVYSTTALEMIRGIAGPELYADCLKEVHRVLTPGGIFGLGEPMHLGTDIPEEIKSFATQGEPSYEKCFATIKETQKAVELAGFNILTANYAEDARKWWEQFAQFDPFCNSVNLEEKRAVELDGGRWLSYGYVIAQKPISS